MRLLFTMRRLLIIGPIVLLLAVVAGVVFLSSTIDNYRPQIQTQLERKLGRPVELGHLGLHLFPPSIKVDELKIQESSTFRNTRAFASAGEVFVSVGLLSLLSGNPNVNSLILNKPQIEVIRNAAGVWNYSSILNKSNSSDSSESKLRLAHLQIIDGQVAVTDQLKNQPRSVYDHLDVDLAHFAPGKAFDLKLGAHLPGEGKQILQYEGQVGPLNSAKPELSPLNGRITMQELALSGLNRFAAGTIPAGDEAIATGQTDIKSADVTLTGKGSLKLTDVVIRGAKLSFPISARYDLAMNRSTDLIELKSASLGLGQTSFNLDGSVDVSHTPSAGRLHVTTKDSSITELTKLAGALGVGPKTVYQTKGTVSADLTSNGPFSNPSLNGSLNARSVEVSGGEIKQPVSIPAVDLAISPDAVKSNTFEARSGSTTLQTQFTLTNYAKESKAVDATLKTSNANVAELLAMAKAYGSDLSEGATATGTLNLNLHVSGPLSSASKLNMAGDARVMNATVQSPTLTKPVSLRSANLQFSQNSVAISELDSSVGSSTVKGSLSARSFAAPDIKFALSADTLDTAELQHLTKPSAKTKSQEPSLLSKVTGTGTLSAGVVKAEDLVLHNVQATCKLDHGLIHLSPLSSEIFGGKQTGSITFDTRPADAAITLNTKFSGVDSNALLSAVSSVKNTLYGRLNADTNLSLSLANSSAALARSMNGTLALNLADGQLKNVNILNEIAKVGKFLGSAPGQSGSSTALKALSGTMKIDNGVASTDNLKAVLDAGSLSSAGTMSLVDQALSLHVNAVLAQGTSKAVGGSGVGGYLNTALANNKGELVLPVIVTGTTSHPIFTPDVQALAKMKLSNLLPTSGDPSRLTSGVIGAVTGKSGGGSIVNQILGGGNQTAGQKDQKKDEQPAQDSFKSILNQFGKKKPKQQ